MKLEISLALLPGGGAANNLSQGQYVDGLIDAAGDIAGTLVAFGKVMKVTGKTCQIITRINQTVQVGTASYNFAQGAQMLAQGGHSWLEISAKTGEGFLHLLGARVRVCFPAGTQVAIGQTTDSNGRIQYQTAAIETLNAGDLVLAREEFGPAVKLQRIEEAFEFTSNHLVMITLTDSSGGTQTVTTTEDHPFWISERDAYLKPADILPGMTMVGPNEERQTVVAVERQVQAKWIPVYNLRISEFHTYFVSQSSDKPPILVHNTDPKDCGEAAAAAAKAADNASNSVEMRPYGGPSGGHHVPSKKAFEGAVGYDKNKVLAIPNDVLKSLKIEHPIVTGAQKSLYSKFAKTGETLTWEVIEDIETKALIRGGANADQALATVRKAIQALKSAGVTGPTRIPWGG